MQLQADLAQIEATGTQVVGISYDPVKVLADFAERRRIQFPLLSDVGSKTITAYGILNKEGKGGIPYPGTYLLDQQGIVRAKLFNDGYRERHPTAELLEAIKAIK